MAATKKEEKKAIKTALLEATNLKLSIKRLSISMVLPLSYHS
jgi:hypothetical protein